MLWTMMLLLAAHSWSVRLPNAQVGKSYSAGLSQNISGCAVDEQARTSPAVVHRVPAGLSVAADGKISGDKVADDPVTYEFGVACTEAKFVVRIKVLPKD